MISLLFFVCDHYRYYELKNKVKSSAYLAASIVQQISNTRTDKQLTQNDLARISYASCLNFFHTNSMFSPWPFGVYFAIDYEYVKRINSNSYQHQHCYGTTPMTGTPVLGGMNKHCDSIQTKTLTQIADIHPDLICNKDGEERLLISCSYRKKGHFKKSLLGFFILEPVGSRLFAYKIVITPKPGLFPGRNE
ncbi:MAG: hypothetical protein IJT36_00135 [Alphaproteobacteria bacterium]|nr:hypothetical protein [Alphaproteobacteria bacterium]